MHNITKNKELNMWSNAIHDNSNQGSSVRLMEKSHDKVTLATENDLSSDDGDEEFGMDGVVIIWYHLLCIQLQVHYLASC
jgi:hypothetical protein